MTHTDAKLIEKHSLETNKLPRNPPDTDPLRRLLLKSRETLSRAEETGEEAEQTVVLDQSRVGRLSRMDAMQAQAMSKETGRRRRRQLRQVEEALKRIEDGAFGDCIECGEPIDPRRLEIDPTVLFCISCAKARE